MSGPNRIAIFAAVVVSALSPAVSRAASVTATGTVTGSVLSIATSAAPSFSANLDSGDANPTYALPLSTQDTRGTGVGWNETITSTQFTTGLPGDYTLPADASMVTAVTARSGTGTNTSPANTISYPVTVPAASSPPAAVKVFDSAASNGMGRFTVTPTISVFVPENSYTGTYTSTVTVSIVSGP